MSDVNGVILITGTSKGIGKALALHYCNKNYNVVGCSRSSSSISDPKYLHFQTDLSTPQAAENLVRRVLDVYGNIDVLINNAGIASMNHIISTPATTIENIFRINFFVPFLLIREVSKAMVRKKYGRIINFSTIAVPLNLEGEAVYASSKAALETLTRISSIELASFGVTVNAIGPAPYKSGLIRTLPLSKVDDIIEKQAIKRETIISDISHVTDFFLHPDAGFITGQTIYLGGVF